MNNTTGVNPNTMMSPMTPGDPSKVPKLETVAVGMFRLPGVKVDLNQYNPEEVEEMMVWARENHAYIVEEKGLFSWKKESLRDWFILRWT
jgi:hypothetical protein